MNIILENSKLITLYKNRFGYKAIVDESDYDMLLKHTKRWRAGTHHVEGNSKLLKNSSGRRLQVSMHRLIMGCVKGDKKMVDHINHNVLDNRKCNLRIVTASQNLINKIKLPNSSSKYKGVYWIKDKKKWRVEVGGRLNKHNAGYFTNEIEAAKKANELMIKIHGEFALLNKV